jgi:hypothetical protein
MISRVKKEEASAISTCKFLYVERGGIVMGIGNLMLMYEEVSNRKINFVHIKVPMPHLISDK